MTDITSLKPPVLFGKPTKEILDRPFIVIARQWPAARVSRPKRLLHQLKLFAVFAVHVLPQRDASVDRVVV